MLEQERIAGLEAAARSALPRWAIGPGASIRLISFSENDTFRHLGGMATAMHGQAQDWQPPDWSVVTVELAETCLSRLSPR